MIESGKTYEVTYPFIKEIVSLLDEKGFSEVESWRPGVRSELMSPDDGINIADGEGKMILHIVDIHKPGRYPTRVFFTRKWRDPDGKEFGKPGLHIMVIDAFNRRLAGFMHKYTTIDMKALKEANKNPATRAGLGDLHDAES